MNQNFYLLEMFVRPGGSREALYFVGHQKQLLVDGMMARIKGGMGLYHLLSYGQEIYWYTFHGKTAVQKINLLPYLTVELAIPDKKLHFSFTSDGQQITHLNDQLVDEAQESVTVTSRQRNRKTGQYEFIEQEKLLQNFLLDFLWEYGGEEFVWHFGYEQPEALVAFNLPDDMIQPLEKPCLAAGEAIEVQTEYLSYPHAVTVGVIEAENGWSWATIDEFLAEAEV